ncbi:protein-L-isoaspartate(D-aspartate) O-methyltransferase [Paradesulfitobacterium ferrireducens]|uniref:protein-L-isoaspartate(D-aspartate) O-methyltransferase n=1 Tax=Paradesulfitobacterium ferrireducens TaxID=2816476 RepID=UPI0022A7A6DF|nr:protein-L-isoaspartate(D-aspartate) O-methyltransferase [Paradesulfitobacterium ferrireducens]
MQAEEPGREQDPIMNRAEERQWMVDVLKQEGIKDEAVLAGMQAVPRHFFVPREMSDYAYDDEALRIEAGQTISQPYIVALMAQALELKSGDRVLEIGTGSGYSAAVLSRLAARVYTIERHKVLADQAGERFARLNYENIEIRFGDGTKGWPEEAPFDAILVTAGGPQVPASLKGQLKVGGRLVMPVGTEKMQELIRVRRNGEQDYREESLGLVRFVPLIGEEGWPLRS